MLIEPSEQEVETMYTEGWETNCDSSGPCHLDEVSRGSVVWGILGDPYYRETSGNTLHQLLQRKACV